MHYVWLMEDYHRITESLQLEETFKDHLVHPALLRGQLEQFGKGHIQLGFEYL